MMARTMPLDDEAATDSNSGASLRLLWLAFALPFWSGAATVAKGAREVAKRLRRMTLAVVRRNIFFSLLVLPVLRPARRIEGTEAFFSKCSSLGSLMRFQSGGERRRN
jgi:hypothetical protein